MQTHSKLTKWIDGLFWRYSRAYRRDVTMRRMLEVLS